MFAFKRPKPEPLPTDINEALVHYKLAELELWLLDVPAQALSDLERTSHKMYAEEIKNLARRMAQVLEKAREAIK